MRDMRAPEDVVLHILHRQEQEVVVHWHGADLAEALAPNGVQAQEGSSCSSSSVWGSRRPS